MTLILGQWLAGHRTPVPTVGYVDIARPDEFDSGMPYLELENIGDYLHVEGITNRQYAGQSVRVEWLWTVASGAGNANIAFQFRRYMNGAYPFSPYSVLLGPGVQASPTPNILKQSFVLFTHGQTGPVSPALGGLQAGERFVLQGSLQGGSTIGNVRIVALEVYVP